MVVYRMYHAGRIYEWDESKNAKNIRKHGVDFPTAVLAFADPDLAVVFDRIDAETGEERWHAIGLLRGMVLLIVHVYRDNRNGEEITHIISAREADPSESQRYFEQDFD